MGFFNELKDKATDLSKEIKIHDDKPKFVDRYHELFNEKNLLETYIKRTDKLLSEDPSNTTIQNLNEQHKSRYEVINQELDVIREKSSSLKERLNNEKKVLETQKAVEDSTLQDIEMAFSKASISEESYKSNIRQVSSKIKSFEKKIDKTEKTLSYLNDIK